MINGLFSIDSFEIVREKIEDILEENVQQDSRSLATMDLWVMLSEAGTIEEFYELIRIYKDEFRDGARKFGQCLEEVIEERKDIVACSIAFADKIVPLSYKLHINNFLTAVRKTQLSASDQIAQQRAMQAKMAAQKQNAPANSQPGQTAQNALAQTEKPQASQPETPETNGNA